MKKLLVISLLALSSLSHAEETKENTVTDATKSVVSGIVKFGKDLLEGADEGVDEGRKTGQSQDGAIIVDNGADLEKNLSVELLSVNKEGDNGSYIELGFKNANDNPVRIINLKDSENIIAIDADGYATNLARAGDNPMDVTIPSKAGRKQRFHFDIPADSVKEVRIMGKVLSL
ncbi:hypothetical protein [Hahella sp. HN01]|uniref:hypothetical protein n=1 Tax=Hahella sp. HN01 TaxID=2847262 RepID=UPI001C1EC893|nr:hypothetical protein [Hahella sp. HN01]MBU6954007.1 hypothetical protein [Hahella sp. HN01]